MVVAGHHELAAFFAHLLVDRTHAMPAPRLDPLHHGVVQDHRDVSLVDVHLRPALGLELFLLEVGGDEREVFTGDPVALRGIAVAAVRKGDLAHPTGDHHDVAADVLPKILLKDAPVVHLYAFDHETILLSVLVSLVPTTCLPSTAGQG